MNGVRAVADYLATVIGGAALLLGKHHRTPAGEQPYGRPWGSLAPTRWRHCPRCTQDGYVLAPGGHIPPCPCISDGESPVIEKFNLSDPANRLLFLADSLGPGGPSAAIEAQEKQGQRQLVNSDRMPTDTQDTDEEFEALGFTFGDPDPADPLFRPATLPDGWKREASDHDMWSYIVDEHGRRRVGVFYKAAFYDRRAHARVQSLCAYVDGQLYRGKPIVLDDVWATREAVMALAVTEIAKLDERIAEYIKRGREEWVPEARAERDGWAAVAAAHDGPTPAAA